MADTTTSHRACTETFQAVPRSVRDARHFVGNTLRAWGCDPVEVVQPAVLLANELVANAVLHAGGVFDLTVRLHAARVRIEVHDGSQAAPRLVPWEEVASAGRGLHLVDAMAAAWGSEQVPDRGKVVWCELPRRPD